MHIKFLGSSDSEVPLTQPTTWHWELIYNGAWELGRVREALFTGNSDRAELNTNQMAQRLDMRGEMILCNRKTRHYTK